MRTGSALYVDLWVGDVLEHEDGKRRLVVGFPNGFTDSNFDEVPAVEWIRPSNAAESGAYSCSAATWNRWAIHAWQIALHVSRTQEED